MRKILDVFAILAVFAIIGCVGAFENGTQTDVTYMLTAVSGIIMLVKIIVK